MNPQQDDSPTEGMVQVLASDLDGTLIPLDGNAENRTDLNTLVAFCGNNALKLVFVTGRHFESVQAAIDEFDLPVPDWIICDVGTSIYHKTSAGKFELSQSYAAHLESITRGIPTDALANTLASIPGLQLQEDEKQSRFKLSFYTQADGLERVVSEIRNLLQTHQLPYSLISSIDPFTNDGLVDLLPLGASKAYAMQWWAQEAGFVQGHVLYAGDSGNDSAVFAAGYCSIIVKNAARRVLEEARDAHASAGVSQRIFAATKPATSGVLEGVRFYLDQLAEDK